MEEDRQLLLIYGKSYLYTLLSYMRLHDVCLSRYNYAGAHSPVPAVSDKGGALGVIDTLHGAGAVVCRHTPLACKTHTMFY